MNPLPPAPVLTPADATYFFSEATGAWLTQIQYQTVIQSMTEIKDISGNKLSDAELKILPRALFAQIANSLGVASLVLPYERYKRRLVAANYNANQAKAAAGTAFGLNVLYDHADGPGSNFRKDYPTAVINTWNYPQGAPAGWFCSMVRNSFAHAQSSLESYDNGHAIETRVKMVNWTVGNNPVISFDILLTLTDFEKLIAFSLQNFIHTLFPATGYEPLMKFTYLIHTPQGV